MLVLTIDQQAAADSFMEFMLDPDEDVMIIEGHAGCGKSTLTQHLLEVVDKQLAMFSLLIGQSHKDLNIQVTAPTNPAARVLANMVGTKPKTIQSLLGLKVQNSRQTGKTSLVRTQNYSPQPNSLILVDEASFLDTFLLKEILDSCPGSKVLLILDPYQLAPPKEKIIAVSGLTSRRAKLSTIMRNPGPIADLAGLYREAVQTGAFPTIRANGKEILHLSGSDFRDAIGVEYSRMGRRDNDARIMAWTNKRVIQYNDHVRAMQGRGQIVEVGERMVTNQPIIAGKRVLVTTDSTVEVTDVGSQTEAYDVPGRYVELGNGHQFFMPDNTNDAIARCKTFAARKDWSSYYNIKENWLDLRPLHASTVHKAQGATIGKVFIDLSDIGRCSAPEEFARLMYVACSRPETQLVFHGKLPQRYGGI